jgi:M6 family metalloprotease-like protein
MMKKLLLFICCLSALASSGQELRVVRGNCTPVFEAEDSVAAARGMAVRRLQATNTQWDGNKTYRQLVILFSFSDTDFQMENPQEVYDSIFNVKGYTQRQGKGCVADYFREQSGGLFNLGFDVFAPVKISTKAQPFSNPSANTTNYGKTQMQEATRLFLAEHPDLDYTSYDWDGDGYVEQVIYVYAGYSGNQAVQKCYGHIWPNTGGFSTITTPDGRKIADYTCSGELWHNDTSCGIGTICHEFTHSLGLPDIYPTSSSAGYSAVDEWDLMDGGNFTNYGWCPPNYSALEKMLMGWLTPVELTEPVTILDMKPVSRGGEVYQIKHTNNEFLLLENRQWEGWDFGLPGKGLAIFHVNYNKTRWINNLVNATKNAWCYDLVHADNMNYNDWNYALGGTNPYLDRTTRLNSRILSTSPYPWLQDGMEPNDSLTDASSPAAMMYNSSNGNKLLSKPITHIRQNDDGTVSFRFMGGVKVKGDLNDDDRVTMADVVSVVNQIALGNADSAADVNGDGLVTVADIIFLHKMLTRTTLSVGEKETEDCY